MPRELRPDELVDWTDVQLDAAFRAVETLPLARILNAGDHRADVAQQEIYNDANWKGYLPKGLKLRDTAARLSTGYAKRFWAQKGMVLGETIYLNGRILLKHLLEEVMIARRTNDLAPGRYLLLRYTDPGFEHIYYDVMKAPTPDLILYRGYTGKYPDGRRGWTAPLMRRFTFAQMGTRDHGLLFAGGSRPSEEDLLGPWRLEAIATSDQLVDMARLQVERGAGGRLRSVVDASATGHDRPLPPFVADHFQKNACPTLLRETRRVDHEYLLGRWTTGITGPFARLQLAGAPGLFHAEKGTSGPRRFTLYYALRKLP